MTAKAYYVSVSPYFDLCHMFAVGLWDLSVEAHGEKLWALEQGWRQPLITREEGRGLETVW